VKYAGKPLQSRQHCSWQVQTRDRNGITSPWSSPALFAVGLLDKADWNAYWISVDLWGDEHNAVPVFRKGFTLHKPVGRALAYVCGLGQFDFFVNGSRQGDSVLDPGWTNYRKTCLYSTFDITPSLQSGPNAIGIMLGNGMYNVKGGRYTKFKGSFGVPCAIVQLEIEYGDGTRETVISDDTWRVVQSPITFSCVYGGEDHDARRQVPGWATANFEDARLPTPAIINGPGGTLRPAAAPPIRVHKSYQPVKVSEPVPGTLVFDFGQNLSGWPAMSVAGPAGAVVRMIPGELLDDHGLVSQVSTGGGPVYFTYTLKGEGIEQWRPQFSYFGFRYVQIADVSWQSESPVKPRIISIESQFVHASLEPVGTFSCSYELFNRTHDIIKAAILSDAQSVLTDCPHREKLGWLDPVDFMAQSIFYNFNCASFYKKLLSDIADTQVVNGLVPDIAPEYVVFGDGFRDSPEWGCTYPLICLLVANWYEDDGVLETHYAGMAHYIDYLLKKRDRGVLRYGLGDWNDVGPNPPFSQDTPAGITATSMLYAALQATLEASKRLGRHADQLHWKQSIEYVQQAFEREFYHPERQTYGSGSQTSCALPLVVGLVPAERRDNIVSQLVEDVRKRGLTAGDVGHRYLLLALASTGHSDAVFDLHSRSDVPGYGYQLAHGATTLIESWAALPTVSQNHCMLGHIEEWFYAYLAGIRPAEPNVKFQRIIIQPNPVGNVQWCKATHNSPYGPISIDWKRDQTSFEADIEIPPNTTALVHLPHSTGAGIEVESGHHHFTVQT
jgi:hypothetical protein